MDKLTTLKNNQRIIKCFIDAYEYAEDIGGGSMFNPNEMQKLKPEIEEAKTRMFFENMLAMEKAVGAKTQITFMSEHGASREKDEVKAMALIAEKEHQDFQRILSVFEKFNMTDRITDYRGRYAITRPDGSSKMHGVCNLDDMREIKDETSPSAVLPPQGYNYDGMTTRYSSGAAVLTKSKALKEYEMEHEQIDKDKISLCIYASQSGHYIRPKDIQENGIYKGKPFLYIDISGVNFNSYLFSKDSSLPGRPIPHTENNDFGGYSVIGDGMGTLASFINENRKQKAPDTTQQQ